MDLSVFQRDISDLSAALSQGLEALTFGSFSERNPGLGKMTRCVFCRTRRREFATEKCCNASHVKAVDGFGKGFIKKFMHKRHGQGRAWHIRQTATRMQNDAEFLKFAASEMHVAVPKPEHVPSFAERWWLWNQKRITRQQRSRQQQARRINFGLV